MKQCPDCDKKLEQAMLYNVEVDYCPDCLGIWFEDEELRWAKDEKDKNLNWLDIDLWRDQRKLEVSKGQKLCPECRMPLYEVQYDNSSVRVDVCNLCKGVWLDRVELKKIISYLKEKSDYEVLRHFSKNISKEFWEIFAGPETFREEIFDFLTLLKLFNYKLNIQHPVIVTAINGLLYK